MTDPGPKPPAKPRQPKPVAAKAKPAPANGAKPPPANPPPAKTPAARPRRRTAPAAPPPRRRYAAFAALLAVAFFLGVALSTAIALYVAPGPLPAATDIVIPHGNTARIADTLQSVGAIDTPSLFRAAAAITRLFPRTPPLQAGAFRLPQAASMRTLLAILRHARPVQARLTIPEGLTAAQIALLLDAAPALTGEDVLPPEGAALPQTYDYPRNSTRVALLARMMDAASHTLAAAWSTRAPDLPLATPDDALILASIVERETARPDERPHIAAVFLNRLRLHMRLQSDPTVIYAATGGLGPLGHPLSHAELTQQNPYNTYVTPALPPAPICAPGEAALQAVLHPAQSADLYFVANGTGGHAFAATLEDHNRNVARWRAFQAEGEVRSPWP